MIFNHSDGNDTKSPKPKTLSSLYMPLLQNHHQNTNAFPHMFHPMPFMIPSPMHTPPAKPCWDHPKLSPSNRLPIPQHQSTDPQSNGIAYTTPRISAITSTTNPCSSSKRTRANRTAPASRERIHHHLMDQCCFYPSDKARSVNHDQG
jgi:hypothetical protein